MRRNRTIAVDFDHTLFNNETPIPGAKEAMQQLHDRGDYIMIYSCNNAKWIERLMLMHDIPYNEIYGKEGGKPICDVYIDDRGIGFDGDWPKALAEIENLGARDLKIRALGVI